MSKCSFTFKSGQDLLWLQESDEVQSCHTMYQEWSKEHVKNFPECDDTKEIIYVFETKVESFTKNGKTAQHVLIKRQELRYYGKAITEKSHLSPSQI